MRARSASSWRGPAGDLADRFVQHARDGADFVGAVVARRLRQIAGGVAFGDRRNRAHAPAEQRRRSPREGQRGEHAGAHRDDRRAAHRRELVADLGQREGEADFGQARGARVRGPGPRRTACRSAPSCCIAARCRCPSARACWISGRVAWFSSAPSSPGVDLRVAHHRAVGADERDARRDQPADGVGFGVELRGGRGLPVRQRLGREPGLVDQAPFDLLLEIPRARTTTPASSPPAASHPPR